MDEASPVVGRAVHFTLTGIHGTVHVHQQATDVVEISASLRPVPIILIIILFLHSQYFSLHGSVLFPYYYQVKTIM